MKHWILLLAEALLTVGFPLQNVERATCASPVQRKAWHSLTQDEKKAYITAEKCLMTLPAKQGFPAARTRFDDLQMVHVKQTADGPIHGVGGFLPFHRYYINLHEKLLRTECNYTGGQPYWNETIDAGSFSKSILLTSDPGFGGNGSGSKGCITDGPFKDYVNSIGPGQTNKDHCIDRKINEGTSAGAKKDNVDCCMQQSTYVDAWHCLEGQIHSAGHGGIGGQMFNVYSSPGDPLFYMHHAWIDKLWTDWQAKDHAARILDMGGTNQGFVFGTSDTFEVFADQAACSVPGGFPGKPIGPGDPSFKLKDGDPANVTTLAHVITSYGTIPNVTVKDVMDVKGSYLCYEYI